MQALESCDLSRVEIIELIHDICSISEQNQIAEYKMGLTAALVQMVDQE